MNDENTTTIAQQLMIMIYKLQDKKSSELFKNPVNGTLITDYYEKIKNPIDLSTIVKKIKQGYYLQAKDVKKDLDLIIENCRAYNNINDILKKADQFSQCIQTEWNNFEKQLNKKNIKTDLPIQVNQNFLLKLNLMQEKRKKKKISSLKMSLIETQRKIIKPEITILPPLKLQLFLDDKIQGSELPKQLQYNNKLYSNWCISSNKIQKLQINLYHNEILKEFDQMTIHKIEKYKRIIFKKIMWIQQYIIQKCFYHKKFRKMQIPKYLSSLIEKGQIANNLQIRKLQMYVKQTTYWIQQYPHILSNYMKDKFVQTCRTIRRCIIRVLRYKRIPKTTKIQIDLHNKVSLGGGAAAQQEGEGKQQVELKETEIDRSIGEDENKKYENKMKEFRRMLIRDRGESTKKDTKIIIRNENGQFTIVDWYTQNNQKKKKNWDWRVTERNMEPEEDELRKIAQEKKEELKRDMQFIEEYKKKSNLEIIEKYGEKLNINWDDIINERIHERIILHHQSEEEEEQKRMYD